LDTNSPEKRALLAYFGLVILLTVPFWLFGGSPLPLPVRLPVSSLEFLVPVSAASILFFRQAGPAGVKQLLRRVFDFSRISRKVWYLPALLLNPLVFFLAFELMQALGLPLPEPNIAWIDVLIYFLIFFFAGACEELGWSGYATDPMQKRWGALGAGLLLGLFWAVYHLIPDIQNTQPIGWIFWHRLGTVCIRILTLWIYNNTGKSVFATTLFHTMNNLSWVMFPNYGSHYNPAVTTPLFLLIVVAVVYLWRPKTLSQYRFAD
jgi:hypothetical protein